MIKFLGRRYTSKLLVFLKRGGRGLVSSRIIYDSLLGWGMPVRKFELNLNVEWGSRDGTVVRARSPPTNVARIRFQPGVICWLSLLLVLA